uniref:Uncharacterized protein n=1 Tax=Tetradesmus obliquus TaxID=3088 RepID=A0A383VVY3_TETOB|eukprot:jgi/Sobl393_1/14926/SZX68586.1
MQQAVSCHVEADPGDELWTALLTHAAATNDLKLSCKLLQLSKAFAAATLTQLAGQLQVQLKTSSLQTKAAWLQRNSCMLRTLQVSLAGAVPEKAEACRMLAAAMITLPMAGLRGFAVRNLQYESADTLLCGLSSVAGQLTQLDLRMKSYRKLSSQAVEVLAGMAQLRELVLHEPNSAPFPCSFNSLLDEADLGRIGSWLGYIGQTLTQLTGLTRLQVPFGIRERMGLLQQLPAGLRELRLGMDRSQSASLGRDVLHEVDADEGAIEAYFPGDAQVRKARRQQPLDLSHLRALTKLQLSAAVPLLSDDKLPVSLLHLHARQCFSLQPLLHLSSLEVLALRPNTVPGRQLLALTQLTALQEVKLFYEGGYYPQGDWLEWDEQLLQQHAAVWPKLPLRSLGFYEDSGLIIIMLPFKP